MGKVIAHVLLVICFGVELCDFGPQYCAKLLSTNLWNDYAFINFTITGRTVNSSIRYNFTIDVKQDTPRCFLHLEGYMQSKGRKQLLANKSLDLCRLFGGHETDVLAVLFLIPFRQIKTLPSKCPIKKGFYYAYDVMMDSSQYPAVLPSALFTVKLKLMIKLNGKLKTVFRGEIVGHAERVSRRATCSNISKHKPKSTIERKLYR